VPNFMVSHDRIHQPSKQSLLILEVIHFISICDLFTDPPPYISDISTRERYYQLVPEKRWLQKLQPLRASRNIRVCEYVYVAITFLVHIFVTYVLNRYCNIVSVTGSVETSYG
jgi:hypothetical protein